MKARLVQIATGGVAILVMSLSSTAVGEAYKDVFSDAAIWLKGAYDRNNTVGIEREDLRNAFSAASMISSVSSWGGGAETNCVRRYENVPCPYANTVLSNVPCFYMPQCVGEDGTVHPRHFLFSNVTSINCRASIVARIRPEMPIDGDSSWLMGGTGFQIGFYNDSGKLRLRGHCGNWQTSDFTVEPGTWMDVAVVPDMNRLQFYAVTNNGTFWKGGAAAGATGFNNATNTTVAFGLSQSGYSSWNPVATNSTSARRQAFRGTIQSFAVWNRLLSDEEVREAFAYPRTDIMRIGMANGSGGEFIKASPDGAKVNPDDWYTMPSALAPGEAVDIDFAIKDNEAALAQVLRLTSLAGSSGGLTVSVNGTAVEETLMSVPGTTKSLFLPGKLFRAGMNTLHLANTLPGTVNIDALALGGSWQMGVQDDSGSEFADTRSMRQGYANGGPKTLDRFVEMQHTNSVIATIPAEFAAVGFPAKFSVRVRLPYGMSYYEANHIDNLSWKLLVNGTIKGEGLFLDSTYQTITAKLLPGDLKAGKNVLSIVNENTSSAWFPTDFWRLEMKPLPKGIVITFR